MDTPTVWLGEVGDRLVVSSRHPPPGVNQRTSRDGLHWSPTSIGVAGPSVRFRSGYASVMKNAQGRWVLGRSKDGTARSADRGALPARVPWRLAGTANEDRLLLVGSERNRADVARRLWSSSDGRTWRETRSFRRRFPTAAPDQLVDSGGWWVLGGTEGGEQQRATMWASPDLQQWIELPTELRGRTLSASEDPLALMLVARRRTVVAYDSRSTALWVWRRPVETPDLVRVSGTWTGVGGPARGPLRPMPGRVVARRRSGEVVAAVQTSADGRFALDLPPGTYVLDGPCDRVTVRAERQPVRRVVRCHMR